MRFGSTSLNISRTILQSQKKKNRYIQQELGYCYKHPVVVGWGSCGY
jgi:hypothetical protein